MNREINFSIILLTTLLNIYQIQSQVVLDRNQLKAWYSNFATAVSFGLNSRTIGSLSIDVFQSLNKLEILYLNSNQIPNLDPSQFNDLT